MLGQSPIGLIKSISKFQKEGGMYLCQDCRKDRKEFEKQLLGEMEEYEKIDKIKKDLS